MAAGPLTILVVEDEAFVTMDAAATLEEAGHEVCGMAADKAEALRLAERFQPEAAVVACISSTAGRGWRSAARSGSATARSAC